MRKLFAADVAALMACLVFSPAASAETPAAASWCAPPGSEGNGTMNVFIVPTSGDNCGVLRMVAQLAPVSGLPTQTGFFRMYGPNGHIGDSTTKYWTYQESYRVDVNQKAFDGSLWCAEFWMQTGSTFTRGSEPVCVEF